MAKTMKHVMLALDFFMIVIFFFKYGYLNLDMKHLLLW